MMENIASQHYLEAARFEQLKKVIHYKSNEQRIFARIAKEKEN
jgi:hypothetical protein